MAQLDALLNALGMTENDLYGVLVAAIVAGATLLVVNGIFSARKKRRSELHQSEFRRLQNM